jgi:hypothetical protein
MAFAGVHFEFGYGGGRGVTAGNSGQSAQSIFRLVSSQNVTTAGNTTAVSPPVDNFAGEPIVRVTAVADSWVAFGETPAPGSEPRVFVPAGETRDYVVAPNVKAGWAAT